MIDDTSGPAFPVQDASAWQGHGMTLRDYFAAKALQGMCSSLAGAPDPQYDSMMAYKMADAMLKARKDAK